jgi:3-deoxy-7-phosphoheptulonate synthase
MLVVVSPGADPAAIARALAERGLWVERLDGGARVAFRVLPHSAAIAADALRAIEGVDEVAAPRSPHPRVDAQPRVVTVRGVGIGAGQPPVVMAGPCCVESREQIREVARGLGGAGVRFLRGGAFKPRTSPYSFPGHGRAALGWLREAADEHRMAVVTELLSEADAGAVAEVADLVQIGSRSMQSYALLAAAGRTHRPLLLKRGAAATVEEWLLAAEHCLHHGAPAVILCERGIRGFDPSTRNLLDLGAVALLAHAHGLPVVVDPSHAAGRRDLVAPLARAALAAGAAGVLVETHPDPGRAQSDGPQAVPLAEVAALVQP